MSLFPPSFSNPFAPPTSSDTSQSSSASSSSPTSSSTSPPPTSSSSSSSSSQTQSNTSQSSSASSSSLTPSSSSSSSSSASSSSSSSPSSSSSSTPSQTSTSSPSSSSPSASPSQYSTSAFTTTNSGGGIETITSVVVVGPSAGSDATTSGSKPFLQNKGELAGVFTVVGLVVVAILVALITNAVRRRQAKKFDRDVAEAAADAAAQAHVPDFTDDDYGYPGDRVNGKEYPERSAYSDGSHGTFGQPAVQPAEAFNMSELPPFDSYGTAGAAGVGAAGVNRARSMGQKNTTPYNAFAGPVTMPNNYYDPSAGAYGQSSMPGGSGFAIAEAEALNGTATGLSRGPSQPSSRLSRNRSMGTTTLAGTTSPSDYSSQASHYPPAAFASYAPEPPSKEQYNTQTRPLSTDNPYGGYATPSPLPNRQSISPGTILPNPFEAMTEQQEPRPLSDNYSSPEHSAEGGSHEGQAEVSSAWQGQDESRMSLRDEEDYGFGGGRRVLKVANE